METIQRASRIGLSLMMAAVASAETTQSTPAKHVLFTDAPKPYGPVPSERQVKWHENEIYGFVHFGPNTFAGREWGFGDDKTDLFNPTDFSADQIVQTIRDGGLSGVILTAKHHDGYCLWPTKFTVHSVRNSPWKEGKGDVVRDMSDACRKYGIKFGVYVSPWDRNHAEYGQEGYVKYYHETINELTSDYGPIFEMWFDGACGGDGWYGGKKGKRKIDYNTYYDWKGVRNIIRKNQPECAIWCGQYTEGGKTFWADARWGGSEKGHVQDPCWNAMGSDGKGTNGGGYRHGDTWCGAEGDVSIRPGWFYHENEDIKVKSPAQLMDIYLSSVGRGANLILNLPPDKRGRIPDNDVASLKFFGEHLKNTFSRNLAVHATFEASSVRGADAGRYGPEKLIDADRWSAWVCDDEVMTPQVVVNLAGEQTFNMIRLREDIRLGQRVDEIAVDAWQNGAWHEIARAQSIGASRIWRIKEVKTDKVRIRVTKASACPALSDFGIYLEPPAPEWSPNVGTRAKYSDRSKWKVTTSFDHPGVSPELAIDGKSDTFWHSSGARNGGGLPAWMAVDLGSVKRISAMSYLPRQDGRNDGTIDRYLIEISDDEKSWSKVAEGEFANIKANPIEQRVDFAQPAQCRFIRFTATHVVAGDHVTLAELNFIEAE